MFKDVLVSTDMLEMGAAWERIQAHVHLVPKEDSETRSRSICDDNEMRSMFDVDEEIYATNAEIGNLLIE